MKKRLLLIADMVGALMLLGSCANGNGSSNGDYSSSSGSAITSTKINEGSESKTSSSNTDDTVKDALDGITSGSATVSFSSSSSSIGPGGSSSTKKSINAAYIIDGKSVRITSGTYKSASSSSDQVVFLVINGGSLTIEGTEDDLVTITKTGSAASGGQVGDDYNFYGINSAIVVAGSTSSATISNAVITTSSNGSNAVVSTMGATINITDSSITTTGNAGSRGLHATYGGKIVADGMTITTNGESCASLATDRGGGTITASNMRLETNGNGSPLVYSTGTIKVTNSSGTANGSQMVVVEGGSIAQIDGCEFEGVGTGKRSGTSESNSSSHVVDAGGIMIYQSMSGDSSDGTDYFIATDSKFTLTTSGIPMFFVTNITAVITLNGNTFNQASSSDYFLMAEETSVWGSRGSNGGKVTITLTNQDVSPYSAFVGTSSSSLSIKATDSSSTSISKTSGTW